MIAAGRKTWWEQEQRKIQRVYNFKEYFIEKVSLDRERSEDSP